MSTSVRETRSGVTAPSTSPVLLVLMACLAGGVLYRLFPLLAGNEALARFFVTEDGYLMLTVARNLAIGNGLTVSDGQIATNGFQPLATYLFALPYWIGGGDKIAGLVGVNILSALIATVAAWRVHAFAGMVLREQDQDGVWPWLTTTLWFLGPLLLLHSMNALETGLYTLMVTTTVWYFGRLCARDESRFGPQCALGVLFGLTFLARNDAIFLVFALLAVRFLHDLATGRRRFSAVLGDALVPGVVSLAIASPWLIYNHALFGSIIPISGKAQSLAAEFGANLLLVPAKLFENMFPMLPVPGTFETLPPLAIAAALITVSIMARFLWIQRRSPYRLAIFGYTLFAVSLAVYYGCFFGAPHFLSRYLAPLAPLLITGVVSVGLDLALRLIPRGGRTILKATGLSAVGLSAVLLARLLLPGVHEHGHFQVVAWVEENVPEESWVGAVQTGTLGYWHDRTINLDGKVNPHALRARIKDGHVLRYVVESEITCLADWSGIAAWDGREEGGFEDAFALVVSDPARNLAVLCRRGSGIGISPGATSG